MTCEIFTISSKIANFDLESIIFHEEKTQTLTANDLSGSPYRGEIAGSTRLGADAGNLREVISHPSPDGVRLERTVDY